MNIVDNFEIIKPLLKFNDPDKFYFLQIIQRRKENPDVPSNNKVIKNYFFNNLEYLEEKWNIIKGLCEFFNARAMLRLNRRSYKTIALKCLVNIANSIDQENYEKIKNQYQRACGVSHAETEKLWIVDIDEKLSEYDRKELEILINKCEPLKEETKLKAIIPSLHGEHFLTTAFNVKKFQEMNSTFSNIDIHKDNPTNLYIYVK